MTVFRIMPHSTHAEVVKLVDTLASGASGGNSMEVRVLFSVPFYRLKKTLAPMPRVTSQPTIHPDKFQKEIIHYLTQRSSIITRH